MLCAVLRNSGGEGEKKWSRRREGGITRAAKHLIDKHAFQGLETIFSLAWLELACINTLINPMLAFLYHEESNNSYMMECKKPWIFISLARD